MKRYKDFNEWFFEGEEYAMRAERFYDMLSTMTPEMVVRWLQASFDAGREYSNGPKDNK
jgi:hypothetical protein